MAFYNAGKRDILILCSFPNSDKIKALQSRYYDLAGKVEPHIAVTFPFDSPLSDAELREQLCRVARGFHPFRIVCRGVSAPEEDPDLRFLNVVENRDRIQALSDAIYHAILPEHLEYRERFRYVPHIMLANRPLDREIVLEDSFEMLVDSLYVERIGDNEESIKLYEITLS
ncbi:MAG: 2'-5' RNA ligase family protein [Oscillospiraceae bacterium]|nr:2'-5' RNA ligase family protein [Oscillospiraceae bacterium]